MEFLAPLMLLGAAGVAIPVTIHLIGRRRAPVVKFAALDFLMGSNRKVARRLRLRELLLLIIRVLACLAIPLAIAKPYASCSASGPAVQSGPQAVVLIIDNSFGARYVVDGESLLSRAKTQSYSVLEQLGPEADVALLLCAERADSPTELSRDHVRIRDAISDIQATSRPADTGTALRRAAQLLAASHHQRKTIFLLSPLAASGFRTDSAADPPWAAGTGPRLVIIELAGDAEFNNTAVTDVDVEPDPSTGSRGVRVTVTVVNFGSTPVEERGIALRIDDREVARGQISLRPGEHAKKQFIAALPGKKRSADMVIELDSDALAVDDKRYVRAELRDEVRVLLVNGDPHADRHDDELFYLETALRPGDRADSGVALTMVTADEFAPTELAEFDVVVLANLHALDSDRVAPLRDWVHAGGGILLTMGDNVDADAYNATMAPLLPQLLKTPLDTAYGAAGAERSGRAQRLVKFQLDHPIFSIFSKDAPGLRKASFGKIMLLGPTSNVDNREVLARYSNGAAALVEARSGKGRLMLFTSSIDRDWNDLAIHTSFLPLLQRIVRHLARKQNQLNRASLLVGQSTLISVDANDTRLEIRRPDRPKVVLEGARVEGRKRTRFSKTGTPGFYRVFSTEAAGDTRAREEADFAVNLDPRGSDLTRAPAKLLPASGDGTGTGADPGTHRRRVELWHALAAGLLFLLLLESILIAR